MSDSRVLNTGHQRQLSDLLVDGDADNLDHVQVCLLSVPIHKFLCVMVVSNSKVSTQASFDAMWYKGRDSASGIDRKLSSMIEVAKTL